MSGMQDVATLSSKYQQLAHNGEKIHKTIDRLKQEAFECHHLILSKTTELERIHETSILLRQLRQFVHAKDQLDHYLVSNQSLQESDKTKSNTTITRTKDSVKINGVYFDIRNLATTAAKLINELENLIDIPLLKEVGIVTCSVMHIRQLGQQLRSQTQERLLVSLQERSQASIAACLQIFYHLQSLPDILLFCIDNVVRSTMDLSINQLDVDTLAKEFPELANTSTTSNIRSMLSSTNTSSNSSTVTIGRNKGITTIPFPISNPLRNKIKEMVHTWATIIYDQSMQIHILQRVIAKKEDPTTQMKFIEILKKLVSSSSFMKNNDLLANGKLLELFWERLSLQDISNQKVKSQPIASSRLYPLLRKATIDIVMHMKAVAIQDSNRDHIGFISSTQEDKWMEGISLSNTLTSSNTFTSNSTPIFGSLSWQNQDIIPSLGLTNAHYRECNKTSNNILTISKLMKTKPLKSSNIILVKSNEMNEEESSGLLLGLKAFCDRYLLGALSRMNFPIYQMFPETEGYTAAIPSKRDLQTLVKAIESELVNAALEGDLILVKQVGREALKAIQLMITKVEDMILTSQDVKKISFATISSNTTIPSSPGTPSPNSNEVSYNRNHDQEHNYQLVVLLCHLKETIANKIGMNVHKVVTSDTSGASTYHGIGSSSTSSSSSLVSSMNPLSSTLTTNTVAVAVAVVDTNESYQYNLQREVDLLLFPCLKMIDIVIMRHILTQSIDVIMNYTTCILSTIPKEIHLNTQDQSQSQSRAIQILHYQLPQLTLAFFQYLPKNSHANKVIQELCLRLMHVYIIIASTIRPVTESSRLRVAQDMSTLDNIIISMGFSMTSIESSVCPVIQEFK